MFHILIPAALSTFGPFGAAIGKMTLMQSFLVRTAIGLALNAMAPKPPSSTSARGYNVTQRGTALDHQIIYGKTKVAGAIVFDATNGSSNKYLHRVLAMAGHEIESYEEIWLNDYKLTLDSDGEVTSATNDGGATSTTRYNGYVRIKKHLGADNQTHDTTLAAETFDNDNWTSAHRLRGIAYLYVRYKFDAEVFPNGVPEIKAVIKGKKVYDPRNSTTAWSDNPALIIRDYITSSDYGLGEAAAQVDDETVKSSANRCDESANGAANDNFFTCNGSFTTAQTPYDILQDLLSSMVGELWYAQGAWRMKAADYVAPTLTLDEDDLRGSMSVSTRHSRRDNFNVIKGTWRGEDSEWQLTDYPEYKVAQAVTDDGGDEAVLDYPLNFTTNPDECQRIARILYERQRQQLIVKATFGLNAFKLQVGDTVNITNSRMGWSSKVFEVTDFQFRIEGADELLVELTLRETASSVYDEISNYVTYEKDNTTLASPFSVQSITGLTSVASSQLNDDGTVVPKIRVTWSVSDESDVDYYIFGWRIGASGTYNEYVIKDKLFDIEPAVAGATYYYSVKAVSHNGVAGTASTGNRAAAGDTTAPSIPTNLSATAGHKLIELKWTNPSDDDFRHVKIQRWNSGFGGFWSDLGYSSGSRFVDNVQLDSVTRYYRIRSEDFSGNTSDYTSSVNATTLTAPTGPAGARGAGQWFINLDTADMPATDALSSVINTKFTDTTDGVGVTPVDKDQAWFTDNDTLEQRVWIYDGTDWNYQNTAIDGNLVVSGTITSDKINVDNLSAISATLGDVTIEDTLRLEAGGAGFLGGRDGNSDYGTDGFYIARTDKGGGNKGYEVSATSVFDDSGTNKLTGIITKDAQQAKIFNPLFFVGGDIDSGGTNSILPTDTNAYDDLGNIDEVTVTVYGGGGAGGYGLGNGYATTRNASGGTTRVTLRRGSATGTVIATIDAAGGQGGLNASTTVGSGSGQNGQSSDFGSGGTGGSRNNAGGDAPATSFGAGGGGAGGDASGWFDNSGGAGGAGQAGQVVTQTIDLSAETVTTFIKVEYFGGGGTATGGSYSGGDGQDGAVKYSSILGGTTQYDIDDLAVTSSLFSNLTVGTGASNDLQQTAAFSTAKDYTVNCKLAIVLYNKNGGSTGSYMPVLEVFTQNDTFRHDFTQEESGFNKHARGIKIDLSS